jgi:hypothetical protein
MCATPSGQDGPSLHWPNAIVRLGSGAIKWRINGAGRERIAALWNRCSSKSSPVWCPYLCIRSLPTGSKPCSHKTIYVRFDLNDYSIPPEAVGRPLMLVASDTSVRILDGALEVARHLRSYDRHQQVLDPSHREAVLKLKRKAFHATPAGRLEQAVPESKTLLDLAFAQGESAGSQTAQLLKRLDEYGPAALRRAIVEALEHNTPRACSVAFLLRRQPRPRRVALDLSHNPQAQSVDVRPHDLETYDELARPEDDDPNPEQ